MKNCKAILAALGLLLALAMALGSACATDFLVTEDEPAGSDTLWARLFGVEEPQDDGAGAGETAYRDALSLLEQGSIVDAMNAFAKLGKYRQAVALTDYCYARLDYLRGDLAGAKAGFEALGDFADAAARAELCGVMSVHRLCVGGQFGYVDLNGQTVIAPAYDWAERVFRDESRAGGAATADGSLSPVAAVFEGTATVVNGEPVPAQGSYGLLGRDGRLVVDTEYDAVLWTLDGLAAMQSGDKVFLFDTFTGAILSADGYSDALHPSQGYVPVRVGDKWGYIDRTGQYLAGGLCWDDAQPFSEGLAAVSQNGLYGYIDLSGALAITPRYQSARAFGGGMAAVRLEKRWGFVNPNGTVLIEPQYQDAGVFSQGACPVKKGGKFGLIDAQNTLLTKFLYDEITPFDAVYHRAWMRLNKLWGLLDTSGTVVLKPSWGTYTPFGANGMSRVSYRDRYGYIDPMGVTLIPNQYAAAAPFAAGYGGVANAQGQTDYLDRFSNGFTVDSDVPTQALCGFIEGRRVTTHTSTDALTGETAQSYSLSYRLYHVDGSPITGWSE